MKVKFLQMKKAITAVFVANGNEDEACFTIVFKMAE